MGRPKFDFHTDGTMLMFGFVCAARMTRRPMRPKPLIPTRIDMVFFCGLRVDSVLCGCAVFGGGGASLEILFCEGPTQISVGCMVAQQGAAPLNPIAAPASNRKVKCKAQAPRGNFRLVKDRRNRESGAAALAVM